MTPYRRPIAAVSVGEQLTPVEPTDDETDGSPPLPLRPSSIKATPIKPRPPRG